MKRNQHLWGVVLGLLLLSLNPAAAGDLSAYCDPPVSGSFDQFLERVFEKEKIERRKACLQKEEGLARTRSSIETSCMRAIKQRMAHPETIMRYALGPSPEYRFTEGGYLFTIPLISADGSKSWDCYVDESFRVTLIK